MQCIRPGEGFEDYEPEFCSNIPEASILNCVSENVDVGSSVTHHATDVTMATQMAHNSQLSCVLPSRMTLSLRLLGLRKEN